MNTLNDALIAEVLERNARSAANTSDDRRDEASPSTENLNQKFSRCLVEAAHSVFKTMCATTLQPDDNINAADVIDQSHISGIISLSGTFKSNVILNLHLDVVFGAAESMMGMTVDKIDNDILDLVRELTNMVAGKAKERLGMEGVCLGLPTVVAGAGHRIALKSDLAIELLKFRSPYGPLLIEFCMMNSGK